MRAKISICFLSAGVISLLTVLNAEVYFTEKEALKFIFPEVEKIEIAEYFLTSWQKKILEKERKIKFPPEYDNLFKFHIGIFNSNIVGYAYIDTVEGKWSSITYVIRISSQGRVENLLVMNFSGKRGKAVKEKKFLNQYINKSANDILKIGRDIDAVTGATISSRAITRGVKKVIVLFSKFYPSLGRDPLREGRVKKLSLSRN